MLKTEGLWENLPTAERFVLHLAPKRPATRPTYLRLEIGELPSAKESTHPKVKTYSRDFLTTESMNMNENNNSFFFFH